MSERNSKLLSYIDSSAPGLEIGPSHTPVAAKSNGCNVEIIDHLPTELLKKKYAENPNADRIENVDYVWNGEKYSSLTGKTNHYAWIIASHVIEHVPDIISFINDCEEVLAEEGLLLLAVPDLRLCFDHFRFPSSISDAIDAYEQKLIKPSPGDILDYTLNYLEKDGVGAWSIETLNQGEYSLKGDYEAAMHAYNDRKQRDIYQYIHKWKFTPSSFKLLMHDLFKMGFISMNILDMYGPNGCEFVAVLSKQMKPSSEPPKDIENRERLAIFDEIQKEIAEVHLKKSAPQEAPKTPKKKKGVIRKIFSR